MDRQRVEAPGKTRPAARSLRVVRLVGRILPVAPRPADHSRPVAHPADRTLRPATRATLHPRSSFATYPAPSPIVLPYLKSPPCSSRARLCFFHRQATKPRQVRQGLFYFHSQLHRQGVLFPRSPPRKLGEFGDSRDLAVNLEPLQRRGELFPRSHPKTLVNFAALRGLAVNLEPAQREAFC